MDIEKKIEVILQTVIDDNKEPMTHIQFIKQKNKWVSEIKWLIKSSNLLLPMSDHQHTTKASTMEQTKQQ